MRFFDENRKGRIQRAVFVMGELYTWIKGRCFS